jgi:hypothetical protein
MKKWYKSFNPWLFITTKIKKIHPSSLVSFTWILCWRLQILMNCLFTSNKLENMLPQSRTCFFFWLSCNETRKYFLLKGSWKQLVITSSSCLWVICAINIMEVFAKIIAAMWCFVVYICGKGLLFEVLLHSAGQSPYSSAKNLWFW